MRKPKNKAPYAVHFVGIQVPPDEDYPSRVADLLQELLFRLNSMEKRLETLDEYYDSLYNEVHDIHD